MRSPKIDSSAHLSASDQQPLPLSILLAMFAELVRRFVIFFVIVELSWNFVRLMCLHILYLLQVMIDCVEQTTGIKTSTQGSSSRHGYEGGCQASWHGSFHVEAVSALLPFSLTDLILCILKSSKSSKLGVIFYLTQVQEGHGRAESSRY